MNKKHKKYDFGGWVTKNDILCSDGTTIRQNAFKECDGMTVPIVYMHNHNDITNQLGHMDLENRKEGVYGWGVFNKSQSGQHAKEAVLNGDMDSLSVFATNLERTVRDEILHGEIKEVSLVLAGANPAAKIDTIIAHSEDGKAIKANAVMVEGFEDDGTENFTLFMRDAIAHSGEDEDPKDDDTNGADDDDVDVDQTLEDILESLDEEDKAKVLKKIQKLADSDGEEDIADMIDKLNDEQIDELAEFLLDFMPDDEDEDEEDDDDGSDDSDDGDSVSHSDFGEEGEEEDMNVFEKNGKANKKNKELEVLAHSMFTEVRNGTNTLKGAFEAHKGDFLAHGITSIENLFTVEQDTGAPEIYRNEEPSVMAAILSGAYTRPGTSVHGRLMDITAEEARAKGYIKGREKLDSVYTTLNRRTFPTTVYAKESFDRDDWLDIDDFDIVQVVKPLMREKLTEEIVRAMLIGDGRADTSADKINPDNIRPIATDDDLYNHKVYEVTAANFVEEVKKNRKHLKGSGKPTLYIDMSLATEIELTKDGNERYLYGVGNRPATDEELAALVGADKCITPDFMDGTGLAILVNIRDYEIAVPKKGKVDMFDDFDIDFNKMKYLIETRMAGALNKPRAAMTLTTAKKEGA